MIDRETTNLTEQTVSALAEMIACSGLSPGMPFAVEAALEKKLNVSRPVLREAVSRLRALGMLHSRQGVGLIVAKPDPVALFEQAIKSYALDSMDLAELGELRYALEIGGVELAVNRATPEQLARLAALAGELADCHAGKAPCRTVDDIELEFHGTILEATHNATLMRLHHVLDAFFRRMAEESAGYSAHQTTDETVWEHRAIAEAFGGRNVERARALLGGHLAHLISNSHRGPNSMPGPTAGPCSNTRCCRRSRSRPWCRSSLGSNASINSNP
jgi:GntR family transcriptional regulator, transcriptional repressor for pyruvate dehydrogenase complex